MPAFRPRSASLLRHQVMPSIKGHGLREYGVGAQILSDLGIRQMTLLSNTKSNVVSLEGYDLEIAGWQGLSV